MKESNLIRNIIKTLTKKEYFVVNITTIFLVGFPDLIVVKNGRVSFLEVKVDMKKNKITEMQKKFLNKFWEYDVLALVIDKNNKESIFSELDVCHGKDYPGFKGSKNYE